jgi:hypothetical protein
LESELERGWFVTTRFFNVTTVGAEYRYLCHRGVR